MAWPGSDGWRFGPGTSASLAPDSGHLGDCRRCPRTEQLLMSPAVHRRPTLSPSALRPATDRRQEQPADREDADPEESPVPPELPPGLVVGAHCPGLGSESRRRPAEGLRFQGPDDLDAVRLRERREAVGRDRGEDNVGHPRLTGGACNEEPALLFGQHAPAHAEGLFDKSPRPRLSGLLPTQDSRTQSEDRPDKGNGLQIQGARGINDKSCRGMNDRLVPSPHVRIRDEGVEAR
jgi:hypothetical protein